LRKNEWVEGIEERFGIVMVSVSEVRVEHQVKIADFMKWLERQGRAHQCIGFAVPQKKNHVKKTKPAIATTYAT